MSAQILSNVSVVTPNIFQQFILIISRHKINSADIDCNKSPRIQFLATTDSGTKTRGKI